MLRVIAANDVGKALNPLGLQGQIEGGVMMGIGHALTEHFIVEDGIPSQTAWRATVSRIFPIHRKFFRSLSSIHQRMAHMEPKELESYPVFRLHRQSP